MRAHENASGDAGERSMAAPDPEAPGLAQPGAQSSTSSQAPDRAQRPKQSGDLHRTGHDPCTIDPLGVRSDVPGSEPPKVLKPLRVPALPVSQPPQESSEPR